MRFIQLHQRLATSRIATLLACLAAACILLLYAVRLHTGEQELWSYAAPLPEARLWSQATKLTHSNKASGHLDRKDLKDLEALCGRCLYHTLLSMWIRDSSVQLGGLLPRIARRPSIRGIVEGGIKLQAFFITQDPYANNFNMRWIAPDSLSKEDRVQGRGGWVGERKFELDSGAYFLHLLWDFYSTPGLYSPERLLSQTQVFEAASLIVDTWIVEQQHQGRSPYRFSHLPREGLGSPVGYTGMVWSGFRPSDDACTYGYSIPSNMFAAAALERALVLNQNVWGSEVFGAKAARLLQDIRQGIERYGIVELPGVGRVYAYEVDGLGKRLTDFDDPNWPSLLTIPLLGYRWYDEGTYARTKARILSRNNSLYYEGKHFRGLGSPHTPHGFIWPLGLMGQALISRDPQEQATILRQLLSMQCSNGLMHESVHADEPSMCTRPFFGWANALLVTAVETLLGIDCEAAAEAHRLAMIKAREEKDTSFQPTNFGRDDPHYYAQLEANIHFDLPEVPQLVEG